MGRKLSTLAAACLALPLAWACTTDGQGGSVSSAGSDAPAATDTSGDTGGTTGGTGTSGGTGGGGMSIPSLVNVNLENVLNDLAVRLNIDRANIPVNAQIPIAIAANVCGVSVNVLSVSTGGQASCTASTGSPELAQVVQQQMSAGGSVGGGAQGGSTAGTSGSTTSGGAGTSGATGTSADSTGMTETSTETTDTTEDPEDPQ
ncbi:MAG TPA: hypothetical protein VGW34_08900 [Allosphingosinicella sp.]|nr:hypothetical protein [Allosphingosinicella sp.]